MNNQNLLNEVYEKHRGAIDELRKRTPGLSAPILIKIPASYASQKIKLMVVGQQTQGWGDGGINDLLACYEDFNFGESYYSSPFWNVTRKIEKILDVQKFSIAWSNLNRCDFNDGRPSYDAENDLALATSSLLLAEIEILRPDVVIFFSGPYFDRHIKNIFTGSHFESVQGFTERELSRVEHELLPLHTYRTYHPKYLRMSGIEQRFLKYIEKINA